MKGGCLSNYMRQRTKHVLGNPRRQLMMRTSLPYEPGELDFYSTVDCASEPYRLYQRMIDVPKHENLMNDCFNYRSETLIHGYEPDFGSSDQERITPYARYQNNTIQWVELPTMSVMAPALASIPELTRPIEWRKLLERANYLSYATAAWKGPIVTLDMGFSLVNFLLEWKESYKLILKYVSARQWIERYHRLCDANKSLTGRARALADERLEYAYGTKLFVNDAKTLWTIICRWKERADRILSYAGTIQRSYKKPLELSYTEPVKEFTHPIFGVVDSSLQLRTTYQLEFHAMAYYTFMVKELKQFLLRLWQLGESFGVRPDAGILWDAIPLTFIIDYFVNVSEYIHSTYSYNWNLIDVKLLDYGHSAHIQCNQQLYWHSPAMEAFGQVPNQLLWSRNVSIYRRQRDKMPPKPKVVLGLANGAGWRIARVITVGALAYSKAHANGRKFKREIKDLARKGQRALNFAKNAWNQGNRGAALFNQQRAKGRTVEQALKSVEAAKRKRKQRAAAQKLNRALAREIAKTVRR
jgi:hypothetical protein